MPMLGDILSPNWLSRLIEVKKTENHANIGITLEPATTAGAISSTTQGRTRRR